MAGAGGAAGRESAAEEIPSSPGEEMNWEGEQLARKTRRRIPTAAGAAAVGLAAWYLLLSPLLSIRPPGPPSSLPAWTKRFSSAGGARALSFPTEKSDLMSWINGEALQPTAAGNPESALYGSVRTRQTSGGFAASFHEGIDIAPASRDRRGRARDRVLAAAPGRVAYLNRYPGNSSYGIYVVLLHPDPIGEIYTLYAHLDSLSPNLKAGGEVAAGFPVPAATSISRSGSCSTTTSSAGQNSTGPKIRTGVTTAGTCRVSIP